MFVDFARPNHFSKYQVAIASSDDVTQVVKIARSQWSLEQTPAQYRRSFCFLEIAVMSTVLSSVSSSTVSTSGVFER